ncbi:MAG: iron-containing alcohol dehydrogenase [Spirochaetales bacterium]|nr:iron-containing alcohol dehydrogenase [Spirochaetales bacterium]
MNRLFEEINNRELRKWDEGISSDIYEIRFGDVAFQYHLYGGGLDYCIVQLRSLKDVDSFVVIGDKNVESVGRKIVDRLQGKYHSSLLTFECTEKNKNLQMLESLIDKVIKLKATRKTCIIGLGGGISGNMSGMVAALMFRGIRFVHIPTTLLAISDSVLSLKQAINSNSGKNLIGLFHAPEMVIANIDFLQSLPKKEVVSGVCEVIKNALTILPETIETLEGLLDPESKYSEEDYRYFITMSIEAKTLVMRNDPYEKHEALILEYGHTIGHAIELSDAGNITHGEAIGLGMLCAADISRMLGYLSDKDVQLHRALLSKAGAAGAIPRHIDPETILSIMKYDNKRGYVENDGGTFHLVLLESIGKPLKNGEKPLTPVPDEIIRKAVGALHA